MGGGRLRVADGDNHRVLRFAGAGNLPSGAPDGVLGQPDLTSTGFDGGWTGMAQPSCLILEPATLRLWVVDSGGLKHDKRGIESRITGYAFNAQNCFLLTMPGRGGENFQIRSSIDLLNWSTIERTDTVPGTGFTTMNWTGPATPSGPEQLYRRD